MDVSALTKTAAFMASIKREFDIESTRVRDSDLAKFLGLMSFFLQYQRIGYKESPDADAYNFEGIAAVMNLRMLIFITRKMHLFVEEKQWANLFVALGCFKDMVRIHLPQHSTKLNCFLVCQLVSLETMETLEDEQLHGVSETMQHNLFYESARMDLIERMCKNFKPTVNSRRWCRPRESHDVG